MITPNGGVFGRNPKFNTVTTQGGVTSTGGLTVTPNTTAPTSNVTIGPSAGASLNAAATHSTMIGSGAGDAIRASASNVAIGRDALGSFVSGALLITTTAAGSGGTAATYTVSLTKDSGDGEMTVYPTISATVGAGGTVTSTSFTTNVDGGGGITSPGSNPSVQSGIIFRPADPVPTGFPSNFRCRLDSVQGNCIAIGQDALLLNSTGRDNICIGVATGDAITTGQGNVCIGRDAGTGITTANGNVIVGTGAGVNTTNAGSLILIGSQAGPSVAGSGNVVIGPRSAFSMGGSVSNMTVVGNGALQSATQALSLTAIGSSALRNCTQTNNTTAIGVSAGRLVGSGTTEHNGACNGNLLIGHQARCSAVGTTNETVIGAVDALGDGSNTTVLGVTLTTQARVYGGTFLSTGANGQSTQLGQSTTLLTGLTGATVTATNLIPANCILLGVTARVTTAITGATSFDIGDGTTANRFGDDIAIALNTTANNCIAPALITAATNVVLTANGSNFTGGAVRLTAHFMTLVAPTS